MASAMVIGIAEYAPSALGLDVTYQVAFVRDNGTLDLDNVVVGMLAGDTTNTLASKLATAVRARATVLGYTIPSNGVILPAFGKG